MDSFSHALWAYVIGIILNHFGAHISIVALIIFAVIPDIALIPIAIREAVPVLKKKTTILFLSEHLDRFTKTAYHLTHSYIVLAAIAAVTYYFNQELVIPLLIGWGIMHITIDIFVHKLGTTISPFYPISNHEIKGLLNWYMNKKFMAINILLLLAALWLTFYLK